MNTFLTEILNPLSQFEIRDLLYLDAPLIGNIHISITNIGFYLIVGLVFIMVMYLLSTNYNKLVSNNWSISQETLYFTIHSIVVNQINSKRGQRYFPFIFGLFIFILINNLIGMVKRSLCVINILILNIFCSINNIMRRYSIFTSRYSTFTSISMPSNKNSYYLHPYYVTGFVDGEGCFTISIYPNKKGSIVSDNVIPTLHPYYVTGFVDGEGSFVVRVIKSSKMHTNYEVRLFLSITNHSKDCALLESIKRYFKGIGSISKEREFALQYRVTSMNDLGIIINHFDKYPLLTKKRADYLLFKSIFELCKNKEHLTKEGLEKIIAIKASLNLGLSEELKLAFPEISPVSRPVVNNIEIKDPNWVVGFTEAEGCFNLSILKQNDQTKVQLRITVTQHTRDEALIKSMVNYFKVGLITKSRNTNVFYVSNIKDINNVIIPFFKKYPLYGSKSLDFSDWCKAALLIQNKEHLTESGLKNFINLKENIRKRKENIRGRKQN